MKKLLLVIIAAATAVMAYATTYETATELARAAQPPAKVISPNSRRLQTSAHEYKTVQFCQLASPAAGECVQGMDCSQEPCGKGKWNSSIRTPWYTYAHGEYVGHERTSHVPDYRLRPDDQIEFVFRVTREETSKPYQLNVGDEISVESFTDEKLNRTLVIQPDGTVTLRLLGQVRATRRTVQQLAAELEERYTKFYKMPTITVTLIKGNTKLEDLRATVDSRFGQGGQSRLARVTPEGTVQLPALGSVPAQGLTLDELGREINERYSVEIEGIEVTPVLAQRAPRFVYVLGEVRLPGRYELQGPTTVMQAIAMAGSWNVGAGLKQIVIFRRSDDWRLMATKLDLQQTLWGKRPCPADEIWVNDSDVVLVPKSPILLMDDFINLVFTRGVYGVMPFGTSYTFNDFTTL